MKKRAEIIVLCVLSACFADDATYSVRVRNTGSRPIYDARVSYGHFISDVGVLIANTGDTQLDVQEPVPKAAVVEWTDADGKKHRVTVSVTLPPDSRDILSFDIDDNNHVRAVMDRRPEHITK